MFNNVQSSLQVLGHMLRADFLIFKPAYKNRLIDFGIYVSIMIVVMGYLMTSLGLRADFGIFMAATLVAVGPMFDVFPCAITLVSDIVGNKVISYDITLPIPSWLAVARIGLANALIGIAVSIFSLPFGLVFVWQQFNPANFSPFWFLVLLLSNAFFYGYFGLFVASFIKDIPSIRSVWMRVMFPLWMLGGFQFTWELLYAKSPMCAYAILLNPFLYTMEGVRAAVLGQAGSLPMWVCFIVPVGLTFLFGTIGVRRILKKLDAV